MFRGASRLISLSHPFTTALYHFPLPLPSPIPSYSSRQKKACLRHILMCTMKDRPSARLPPTCDSWPWRGGKQLKGIYRRDARATWRESGGIGWDCLYLFLCLCYSCGLPESGDSENSTPSISFKFMFTSPSSFWHRLRLQGSCILL